MTTVFVLGDSLTCGRGVGVRVASELTWPALLGRWTPGIDVRSFAAPGARIADVRQVQLPWIPAETAPGAVVIVIAGLNDICRSGFTRSAIARELSLTLSSARKRGATVVLGRLHDPARVLGLRRGPIEAAISSRVATVNGEVDAAAAQTAGVRVLDLEGIPALASRGGWACDRIHPSAVGHRAIACAAADVLFEAGLAPRSRLEEPGPVPGPSAAKTAWWAVRHGLPYSLRHVPDFGPPMLAAIAGRTPDNG
jgi:lysophospholipase L1-like esterase